MNMTKKTMPAITQEQKSAIEPKAISSAGTGREFSGQSGDIHSIFYLQRVIGNQEILRLLRPDAKAFNFDVSDATSTHLSDQRNQSSLHTLERATIQPKLAFSNPGDIYEQEAELVADQVLQMAPPDSAPIIHSCQGSSTASSGVLLVQGFWEELGGLLQGGADLASGRWVWDPITSQLDDWERELDRIGEESGLGVGTNVMLSIVSLLYVILRAIMGTLDLLARLNPASISLQAAATTIRTAISENPQVEIARIAGEAGQVALDIITLGVLRAIDHLREGVREANVFRITQAIGEIALAVLAIVGIFRAIRGLRARSSSAGGSTPPSEPAPERPSAPPEPVPERASTPPQEQTTEARPPGRRGPPETPDLTVPRHLLALQSQIEQIFSRLGGGRGYRILICDEATLIDTQTRYCQVGRLTREMGGALTDPEMNVIWVHEQLIRSGGLVRSWGSRLNLSQVIAHEIGHSMGAGATECHLASRIGANLSGLSQLERLGLLDDAVQIARHQHVPLDALNLPPGYTPPPPTGSGP